MTDHRSARRIVVKVGTSSITHNGGQLNETAMAKLCSEIAGLRSEGHEVVLVSSAAIAAGMARLGLAERPRDFESLQALSAVGQIQLMAVYDRLCAAQDFAVGQVLLAPPDFFERGRYLRARSCIDQQLVRNVLPVINENDAVADDAIRFGDNDRIAALVAQLIGADLLVLLTDTDGLLTANPNVDDGAELIRRITQIDRSVEHLAQGASTTMSQGGMSSKLSAAKIAAWSGVPSVIAAAHRSDVLNDVLAGVDGSGTFVDARESSLSARKLWIAFALEPAGSVHVDDGAVRALTSSGGSLLPVGITAVDGEFAPGDAIAICDAAGATFARGLARVSSTDALDAAGVRLADLDDAAPAAVAGAVVHRDDLVLLPS